jgi:thiol:disulfide interchange protein DsbA
MKRRILIQLASLTPILTVPRVAVSAQGFDEGIDFKRLAEPTPATRPGPPHVQEVFWYGCPHCHQLEPLLESWHAQHQGVIVSRLPAVLGPNWAAHARAFYAAESLGQLARVHRPLFDAIHVSRQKLDDEDSLVAFAAGLGLDARGFRLTMNSFGVQSKLRQAAAIVARAGLDGVPAFIVNGRYVTSPAMVGGRQRALEVLTHLLNRV